MKLKQIEKQLKRYLSYINPSARRAYKELLSKRKLDFRPEKTNGVLVFRPYGEYWHGDMGRYVYLFVKAFANADYQIVFYPEYGFLARLDKYKKLLLNYNFKISDHFQIPKDSVYFPEYDQVFLIKEAAPKASLSFSTTLQPIPYMMHPKIYESGIDKRLAELRKNERSGRVLFAGNLNPKSYSGGNVQKLYQKEARFSLVDYVRDKLPQDRLRKINLVSELDEQEQRSKFTLVDTGKISIPFENWLSTLSAFDFFLAAPGTDMPMCHNAVEAMAVGCIPILEYSEYFHPALKDGINCISFKSKEDLLLKLEGVFSMPLSLIENMRKEVITYYETYLSPQLWASNLVRTKENNTKLVFNSWKVPEYH
ncbi:hypothetical protein PZB74_01575 [Porifericola rhodea]|uniref:hypothetical protein n=1 Tax=Porifericola rhodea TaxID=930972 RepID=UPI002664F7B0|nr:hypothetical protein [Porifericola rhodea]WKN32042.1 hypothetical protein PZB74_01575 [Porifericola rhodea]